MFDFRSSRKADIHRHHGDVRFVPEAEVPWEKLAQTAAPRSVIVQDVKPNCLIDS